MDRGAPTPQNWHSEATMDDGQDLHEPTFSFSEADLIPSHNNWPLPASTAAPYFSTNGTYDEVYSKQDDEPGEPKITVSRSWVVSKEDENDSDRADERLLNQRPDSARSGLSRSWSQVTRKTKSLRTKSRSPNKRSSVGTTAELNGIDENQKHLHTGHPTQMKPPASSSLANEDLDVKQPSTFTRTRSLVKKSRQSLGAMLKPGDSDTEASSPKPPKRPSAGPLSKTFSSSNLPSSMRGESSSSVMQAASTPTLLDKMSLGATGNSKKDPQWTTFRSLDADFQKFKTKIGPPKMNVVRLNLIPFLRNPPSISSIHHLNIESLDRRIGILEKWWAEILEMLKGAPGNSISGTDRPLLLDALTGIMERPEWRPPQSPFCPLRDRTHSGRLRKSESKTSVTSDASDYVVESVLHNIHNTFVQKLFTQMVLAVEKMSLKTAPASMVGFCGKACAYAFMFCPGVAEILVRSWSIPKKALEVCFADKPADIGQITETVLLNFPEPLHHLAFTSAHDAYVALKKKPALPLGTEKVDWDGYWVTRWRGRDSDLFYLFYKHIHQLFADFMYDTASPAEISAIPGLKLVRAQMYNNIDMLVHVPKSTKANEPKPQTPLLSFDDFLDPDIPITSPPNQGPTVAARFMTENRIIKLLREALSEDSPSSALERCAFAEGFCTSLEALARTISMYDYNACFALCDILQEALPLVLRFEDHAENTRSYVDWPFWVEVFRKMIRSESTMTEIRLYSFMFNLWPSITLSAFRKETICLSFLLDQDIFFDQFLHWCPMVRAYFMRLICWRIARFDGYVSESDNIILETLYMRLQGMWSYYRYVCDEAESIGRTLPTTAPCNPAPGRRLLIIRIDTPSISSFSHFTTSRIAGRGSSSDSSDSDDSSRPSSGFGSMHIMEKLTSSIERGVESSKKGSAGLFRSIMSYGPSTSRARSSSPEKQSSPPSSSPPRNASPNNSPRPSPPSSRSPSPTKSSRSSVYEQRPSSGGSRAFPPRRSSRSTAPFMALPSGTSRSHSEPRPHQPASFKFSLEFVDRRPSPDLELTAPRLPLAAHMYLESLWSEREGSLTDLTDAKPVKPPPKFAAGIYRYGGRALAEWMLVVNECQNFFERRRSEGVPSVRLVETPTLGVEIVKRPG